MKGVSNQKHMIDLLFPIMLWAVLLICSIFTVILGIHFYQGSTERISSNYEIRTVLSYVREKIHQADTANAVSLGFLGETESLILEQYSGEQLYKTYIYAYDDALWELTTQDGITLSPKDGTKLFDVKNFRIAENAPGVYTCSCTDAAGRMVSTTVSTVCH